MKSARGLILARRPLIIIVVLICWSSAFTIPAQAQGSEGQNAVCTTGPNCSPTVGISAFIDANMYLPPHSTTQGLDICDAIEGILSNEFGSTYPTTGAVVDARGVSGTTNLTCSHGSPWTEGSNSVSLPSTDIYW